MLSNKTIIEIPIYRVCKEQYSKEMDSKKSFHFNYFKRDNEPLLKESIDYFENSFSEVHWYPWKYNEIIGWIEINASKCKLTGELWFTRTRITKVLKNKKIFYKGKIYEYLTNRDFLVANSNDCIYKEILQSLKENIGNHPVNKYFIDYSNLNNIGSYLDWKSILLDNNR